MKTFINTPKMGYNAKLNVLSCPYCRIKCDHLPIINGLSNFSHPCQILSDIFTIEEFLGPIDKQNITWVGDINNVLISLLQESQIFRFRLMIASPKALLLKNRSLINKFKSINISFCSDPIEAIKQTDGGQVGWS